MSSLSPDLFFDSKTKSRIRRRLKNWFAKNQRDLPWRKNKTLYRIWVSEIMLQQTQVATVIDYYKRFMREFPNVRRLAEADVQQVLKLWEGLGYYRRARQMHAAAKVIIEKHRGRFPRTFDDVVALPGIGRYTAGAILSIAADQPLPILEGNTERLFCRLLAHDDDPKSAASQKMLWEFSAALLPKTAVGDFNQSLMELGALVCTPKSPKCSDCPIRECCLGNLNSVAEQIPIKLNKMKYESVVEAAVVVTSGKQVLLRKGQPGERWVGMWDFPRYRVTPDLDLPGQITRDIGCDVQNLERLCTLNHAVTRFRIQLECYLTALSNPRPKSKLKDYRWFSIQQLPDLALNVTARKIAVKLATR